MDQESNCEPPAKKLPNLEGQSCKDDELTGIKLLESLPGNMQLVKIRHKNVSVMGYIKDDLSSINNGYNFMNCIEGFLYIMNSQEKPPFAFCARMIYPLPLLLWYFIDLVLQIAAWGMKKDNHAHYAIATIVSLAILIVVIFDAYMIKIYNLWKKSQSEETKAEKKEIGDKKEDDEDKDAENHKYGDEKVDDNKIKCSKVLQVYKYFCTLAQALRIWNITGVLKQYLLYLIETFLIFSSVICHLYGFINERSWQGGDAVAVLNFITFVSTLTVHVLYVIIHKGYLMISVIKASYIKYYSVCDGEEVPHKAKVGKNFLYVIAIYILAMSCLIQYIMLAITGVQMYDDGSSVGANTSGNVTGSYKVSVLTFFMILSSVYLPFASWITFIMVNKYWFYEIYSNIKHNSSIQQIHLQSISPWVKLSAFFSDPAAYVGSSIFLMPVFIFFILTLIASSEETILTRTGLTVLFSIVFLLANIHAVLVAGIIYMLLAIMIMLLMLIWPFSILLVPVMLIIYLFYLWSKKRNLI